MTIYKTHHVNEHPKQQHCPICNRYVKFDYHYPDYVCIKCAKLTTDKKGNIIEFYNITSSGHGCQAKYAETGKLCRSSNCFIKGIKCFADEAYLGGIIIRPIRKTSKVHSQKDSEL